MFKEIIGVTVEITQNPQIQNTALKGLIATRL
jgi:hypothetical protein